MNLLKALFSHEAEATNFFEDTYPLTTNFFASNPDTWQTPITVVAMVKDEIRPEKLGHVRFHGVRWRACSDRGQVIPEGAKVRVLGRRTNILVVAPV